MTAGPYRRYPTDRYMLRVQHGFSLVELMVSLVIGLVILGALVGMFVNTSGSNREMARANTLIEGGRLSLEVLESDIVHAITYPARSYTFLVWNLRDPLFESPKVRRALTMGINRQQIVDALLYGFDRLRK